MIAATMPLFDFVLVAIYLIGLVVIPIVLGVIFKNKKLDLFEDFIPLAFLTAIWPCVLALASVLCVGFAIITILGLLYEVPFVVGVILGKILSHKRRREHAVGSV